jgi:allantoin racemase
LRILVINPNTTAAMTATIEACAAAAASQGTTVTAVTPAMGPVSIESHYDEALAVPGLLAEIARAEEEGSADGYVIACFGDPGLDAARELARAHYGLARFCRRVRACEIGVLALEEPGAHEAVLAECRRAVAEDGADAVVLGCAGMAELCQKISAEIGVPVVDGVAAATRTVETLVALGLRTGDQGEYARPPAKPYTGLLRDFQVR